MADNFKIILGTSAAKVWKIAKDGRGAVCLQNTRPSALLLEPLFIDNHSHLQIAVNKSELIAQAIVKSVMDAN